MYIYIFIYIYTHMYSAAAAAEGPDHCFCIHTTYSIQKYII
jgi:hypothetical protein